MQRNKPRCRRTVTFDNFSADGTRIIDTVTHTLRLPTRQEAMQMQVAALAASKVAMKEIEKDTPEASAIINAKAVMFKAFAPLIVEWDIKNEDGTPTACDNATVCAIFDECPAYFEATATDFNNWYSGAAAKNEQGRGDSTPPPDAETTATVSLPSSPPSTTASKAKPEAK